MSQINVSNLTFSYESTYDNIFDNVCFQIDTDWKLGFIGRNGRGKTTFLNLLLNKYEYSGNISATVNFDYFPYIVQNEDATVIEILEEIAPNVELWEVLKEINKLEIDEEILYRIFNTLSHGERTKIMLAILFLKPHNFLLIDEPTNHLDDASRTILSNYLKSKKGFIVISHDRVFLDNIIDHVLSINKANIEVQRGNFSTWYANKQLQDNFEINKNEKLKKEIDKLSKSSKRTSGWSDVVEKSKTGAFDKGYVGHKSAKMMKTAKNLEQRQNSSIAEKESLLKNIENESNLKIAALQYTKKIYLTVENVSIIYDKIVCENVNFKIEAGDRISLSGKNGAGKSSIVKLILGENINHKGNVTVGSGLTISYVSQDTSFLKGSLKNYAMENNVDEVLFKTILRNLNFDRIQFEKNLEEFSGGQKKKVLIAKSLCEKAHLYIWDEPLNFIDVLSRIQIEELILQYKPTMLFIEHDTAFVKKVATNSISI